MSRVLRKNPNVYSREQRLGHVEALMRRINALEAGIVGGSGYAFSHSYSATYPNPPYIEVGTHVHCVRRDANELHICQSNSTGLNTNAVQVFTQTGTYVRQYAPYDAANQVAFYVGVSASGVTHVTMADKVGTGLVRTTRAFSTGGGLLGTYSLGRPIQVYLCDDGVGNKYVGSWNPSSGSLAIVKLNSAYVTTGTMSSWGISSGQAKSAWAGIISSDGDLYFYDGTNGKILRYTTAGAFVSEASVPTGVTACFDLSERLHIFGSTTYAYSRGGVLQFTYSGTGTATGIGSYASVDSSGRIHTESSSNPFRVYIPSGSGYSQTAFSRYDAFGNATSLGTPDAGASVPASYALSTNQAWLSPQHIVDMRTAIEAMAANFTNPATGNAFNFTDGSVNNLYYVAMGDRSNYGGRGPRYTWTRTLVEMLNTPTYDIDIGEIHECVSTLEAA